MLVLTIARIVATLAFTYVVASDVLLLLLRRFLKKEEGDRSVGLFLLTRGAGPALVSVVNYALFLVFPQQAPAFYPALIVGIFGVLLLPGRRELPALFATYRRMAAVSRELLRRARSSLPLLAALVLVLLSFLFGVAYPIVEHDSVGAAVEARIMVRDLSLDNYLHVRTDPETGYATPGYRTPFLQMLYVWFALAGGPGSMDLLARTVSPVYGLFGLLLLGGLVRERRSLDDAVWAVFLLAGTPLFFYMSYNNGIDTARIYLALAALAWFAKLTESEGREYRLALATGFFSGLALFSHLLGILAVAGGGLVYLALGSGRIPRKALASTIIALTAGLVGAQFHYVTSRQLHGSIADSVTAKFWQELTPLSTEDEVSGPEASGPAATPVLSAQGGEVPTGEPAAAAESGLAVSGAETPPGVEAEPAPAVSAAETPAPAVESETAPSEGPAPAPLPVPEPELELPIEPEIEPEKTALETLADVLAARGQPADTMGHLLFGRLQIFTGIEFFGIIFYLFLAAAVLWLRSGSKATLDKVLLAAALVTLIVVISGVRKLSWSNPRYVGSVLAIAAFFAAPLVLSAHAFLRRRASRPWTRGVATWSLVLFLLAPTVLATSIRGAKVEITNPGTFYRDFRSFKWLTYTLEDPRGALRSLWRDYLGIRKTVRYLWADDRTKLRHAHDYFAGVQYVNENTPPDAKVLLFRDARFFYYGQRRGVVWHGPEVDQEEIRMFIRARDMAGYLCARRFTHVLVDDFSRHMDSYAGTIIDQVLTSPKFAVKLYEFGTADVFRLRCDEPLTVTREGVAPAPSGAAAAGTPAPTPQEGG